MLKPIHISLIIFLYSICFSLSANADHYDLDYWENWSEKTWEGFHALKLTNTKEMLSLSINPGGREKIAKATGWSEEETLTFALKCEFLEISGVGPKVANLIQKTGIVNTSELAASNPEELLFPLLKTNSRTGILGVSPSIENVKAWVELADQVTLRVQLDK